MSTVLKTLGEQFSVLLPALATLTFTVPSGASVLVERVYAGAVVEKFALDATREIGPYNLDMRFDATCLAGEVTVGTPSFGEATALASVVPTSVAISDRLGRNDWHVLCGNGVPVDYTDGDPVATGQDVAGPASLYVDLTGKKLYINNGTKAQPVWGIFTSA